MSLEDMATVHESPVTVGIDGSPCALDAAQWAGAEARSLTCPLRVVHASVWPMADHLLSPASLNSHRQRLLDEQRRWMREAGEAAREAAPGVDVVELSVLGEPAAVLIGESQQARELVLAPRGLHAPAAERVGSTVLTVAQHAACTVVVIRDSALGDPRGPVVVGIDGSAGSDAAVEFAFEHAARGMVPLVAVQVWSDARIPEQDGAAGPTLGWAREKAEQERLLAERLARWQAKYPDLEVRRVVAKDRPVHELVQAAAGARMVVVGARGRGGASGMPLGSTSQSLLYVAPCPVAIVRHSPTRTPGRARATRCRW
jgi:nucleotide-binding universal stress UspA family protein